MSSSGPFHGYYQQKLTEYRTQIQHDEQEEEQRYSQSLLSDPLDDPGEPLKLTLLPQGITRKELDYIKLTVLFVAWYGMSFYGEWIKRVRTDVRFEFIRSTDSKSDFFSQLIAAYSTLVKFSAKPDTSKEALVHGFFNLLQQADGFQQEEGVEIDMFGLRALQYVASLGDKEFLPARQPSRIPPGISVPPPPRVYPLPKPSVGEHATTTTAST